MLVVNPSFLRSYCAFEAFIPAIASNAAAGYRRSDTGALNVVGANGYAWSSSSYGGSTYAYRAGNLDFNSTNVNPLGYTYRANAFPVRCVQHLRTNCFC